MGAYFYNITGDKETVFVDKKEDLPRVGKDNIIYVVREGGYIYIWDVDKSEYKSISGTNGSGTTDSNRFGKTEW